MAVTTNLYSLNFDDVHNVGVIAFFLNLSDYGPFQEFLGTVCIKLTTRCLFYGSEISIRLLNHRT